MDSRFELLQRSYVMYVLLVYYQYVHFALCCWAQKNCIYLQFV